MTNLTLTIHFCDISQPFVSFIAEFFEENFESRENNAQILKKR
jgi:hypothetical protein